MQSWTLEHFAALKPPDGKGFAMAKRIGGTNKS
jgi:hypothetical protein